MLDRFSTTASSAHELWRPLVVAIAIAAVLLLIGRVAFGALASGALFASIVFLILALNPLPAFVMASIGVWWILVLGLRRWRAGPQPRMSASDAPVTIAIVYSAILLVMTGWTAGSAGLPQLGAPLDLPGGAASPIEPLPNIYLIVLDGYPRADTQADSYGMNADPFIGELAQLGFTVAVDARSNYTKTWLTHASLLNGQYVHELPELRDPPGDQPAQGRLMEELSNSGAVLRTLRAQGYDAISVPSPVASAGITRDAEVHQVPHLSSLEISLTTSTVLSRVFPDQVLAFLASDAEAYVHAQLDRVVDTARASDARGPMLVMAHVMAPHPPFVMGQTTDYLQHCFPTCKVWETTVGATGMTEEQYAARMRTQLQATNERLIDALRQVVRADPTATIVVMSDHGSRNYADNIDEHFRILFAARPGAMDVNFPDDVSPVNVFRRILSTGFGANLDDLPYEAWASDWYLPLELSRHE